MLNNKKILLGVCGSIAAYKAALLVRLLVKAGAEVRVIMTADAQNFITPLTLSTLSKHPILAESFNPETGEWNNHVEWGLWADFFLVAPASANTLAKFAAGICDNLLTAIYLSARCTVVFAPAMDLDMWAHPATVANVGTLQANGNMLIAPGSGELASGLSGNGRMAEPEEIFSRLEDLIREKLPLKDLKAMVSAGPTYEAIDPVRFIGNHSSGKMGYAIAEELYRLGADVLLVSGPVSLPSPPGIRVVRVTSAKEMLAAMDPPFDESDIVVMSAAVADYAPETIAEQKIKKTDSQLSINLVKTADILGHLGQKKTKQVLVGFALETENETANAVAKIRKKNLDFIVLNSLRDEGAGFSGDQNKVTFLDNKGASEQFKLKPKREVAADICERIIKLLKK